MYNQKLISAILLCGGLGTRLGGDIPKQFKLLNGKPLALYSFDFFIQQPEIDELVVVVDPNYQSIFSSTIKPIVFAAPGNTRQNSVYQGLLATSEQTDFVCVHDSARPFITRPLFLEVLDAADRHNAAALAVPVINTIKQTDKIQRVIQTLPREQLWEIQTPQIIQRSIFFQAFLHAQKNDLLATDDLSLIESIGQDAFLVKSSYQNVKITTPIDWELAKLQCALN